MRLALIAALGMAGCGLAASDTPKPAPRPGSISYQISCQAPIVGEVKQWVTYTVSPSAEPVASGEMASYEIAAPPAKVESAVGTSFVSSHVLYPLPEGLHVTRVSMRPSSTADVASASAKIQGGSIVVDEQGDFPLDGSKRDIPRLRVEGTVTAEPGGIVRLLVPTELVGTANAGVFGDQTSTCHVIDPGPIYTSQVE